MCSMIMAFRVQCSRPFCEILTLCGRGRRGRQVCALLLLAPPRARVAEAGISAERFAALKRRLHTLTEAQREAAFDAEHEHMRQRRGGAAPPPHQSKIQHFVVPRTRAAALVLPATMCPCA